MTNGKDAKRSFKIREVSRNIEQSQYLKLPFWVGGGLSIRARARLLLTMGFLIVVPILGIGVLRTSDVAEFSRELLDTHYLRQEIAKARINIERVRGALWRLEAQWEVENQRTLISLSSDLKMAMSNLLSLDVPSIDRDQIGHLMQRCDGALLSLATRKQERLGIDAKNIGIAHLSLRAMAADLEELNEQVYESTLFQETHAQRILSEIGRDQLVLFLILLFCLPLFLLFFPAILVAPLRRLRKVARQIEEGRAREISVQGQDEISQVARVLRTVLLRLEDFDHRKSAKIFELRNILRTAIAAVSEPVLIIDRDEKISYANRAAAALLGVEMHNMEGQQLQACFDVPALNKAIEDAKDGDVSQTGVPASIPLSDGRIHSVRIRIGGVRNRQGSVSRIVLTFYREGGLGGRTQPTG